MVNVFIVWIAGYYMVNFREYVTASGLRVLGGKDAESNDDLVNRAGRNDVMLHTLAAGSPFANVGEKPSKKDLKEAAVFCAKYSQDWRGLKMDVVVNVFKRGDMKKGIFMKAGSWKVGKQERMVVKKEDVLKFETDGT